MHTTLSTGVAWFGIGYSDKIRKHVGSWNIYTFKPKISPQIFVKFNAQIILCLTVFDRHKIIYKQDQVYIDRVPYFPQLTRNTFQSPNANMATFHQALTFGGPTGYLPKITLQNVKDWTKDTFTAHSFLLRFVLISCKD